MNRAQAVERAEKCRILFLVTVTFDLDLQICPSEGQNTYSCEFDANPFSGSGDISCTNKKVTDSARNRTVRSGLRAVIKRYCTPCIR